MKLKVKRILFIDGVANLILGILLLLFPFGTAEILGVPQPEINFYPTLQVKLCGYESPKVVVDSGVKKFFPYK